jgi:hypothetical protein
MRHMEMVLKMEKKMSYEDHKFRLLQVIYELITKDQSITITLHYVNNSGPYLNFMIIAINDHSVKMTYSDRQFNYSYLHFWHNHSDVQITLTHINPFERFDSDIFPEIAEFVQKPC